jgi:hypothetical protein
MILNRNHFETTRPSERFTFHLFMIKVTLDQTLGNWYQFIKPNHRVKNLLTVKYLLVITVAARSKGSIVFARPNTGIVVSNPT